MNEQQRASISKFLSLILRHNPEKIGLQLDENGWANVEELVLKAAGNGRKFSREELEEVVVTNDKQRFSLNEGKTRIRASQGHSIKVELELQEMTPPEILYHGTVERFLQSIRTEGLKKMKRNHVHLSQEKNTAERVGGRRGTAIILIIRSAEMHRDGFAFYLSGNGVWLTDQVPVRYIDF